MGREEREDMKLTESLQRLVESLNDVLSRKSTIVGSLPANTEEDLGGEDDTARMKTRF